MSLDRARVGDGAHCGKYRQMDVQEVADFLVNIKREQSGPCAKKNDFSQRVETLDEIFQRAESHVNRQLGTHTGDRTCNAYSCNSSLHIHIIGNFMSSL